jgi:hypothetical protein
VIDRGGETMRSAASVAAVVAVTVVTVVILAIAVSLVWWLWSVFVHPLADSDPEPIAAAATMRQG